MALFQCSIYSECLLRNVNVNVTLPFPNVSNMESGDNLRLPKAGEKYQTLWLLHCGTGDYSEFSRFSRVEEYAQQKQLAVVMPDADNSWYVNVPYIGRYYDFISAELPEILRAAFPLSDKREHNFIGGASMGGFGAFATALRNPESYGGAFSLSGGLEFRESGFGDNVGGYMNTVCASIFGKNDEYFDPHCHDLATIAKDLADSGKKQPLLYAVNGSDDPITFESSPRAVKQMRDCGLTIHYHEEAGGHNWDFWDPQLKKALDFLPLTGGFVE